jgi:hypothetical protein
MVTQRRTRSSPLSVASWSIHLGDVGSVAGTQAQRDEEVGELRRRREPPRAESGDPQRVHRHKRSLAPREANTRKMPSVGVSSCADNV